MKQAARIVMVMAVFSLLSLSKFTAAQQDPADQSDPVAKRTDIYCTGFISETPLRPDLQVIGADRENFKSSFWQGDVVFLNKGREGGVQPGAVYYVIRPLGEVKHPFKKKKLGHLVRELGMLRVLEVHEKTSVAEIIISCDTITFGDMLKPYEEYQGPDPRDAHPLPRYGEGSGDVTGQIVMSPNYSEYLAANRVVYIDLGSRQDVRPGDYFTIFRQIGRSERIATMPKDDIVRERSDGYGSKHYKGGDFSIESGRVPQDKVFRTRPAIPRKVLGEMVVLKVEKTTAVALITRTNAEINIGDFVERAN